MSEHQLNHTEFKIDNVMTVKETADYLHLHPKTVCAYIREGKLRASLCGNRYLIRRSWVDEFLNETSC